MTHLAMSYARFSYAKTKQIFVILNFQLLHFILDIVEKLSSMLCFVSFIMISKQNDYSFL